MFASVLFTAVMPRVLAWWSGHVSVSCPWEISESLKSWGPCRECSRLCSGGEHVSGTEERPQQGFLSAGLPAAEARGRQGGVCPALPHLPLQPPSLLPCSPGLCCHHLWSWAESRRLLCRERQSRRPPGQSWSSQVSGSWRLRSHSSSFEPEPLQELPR